MSGSQTKVSYPEQRAAQSRAAILKAGETCFLSEGYPVSMEVIRREAGVSRATLFSHFGTKEALYRAVITAVSDRELMPIFEILETAGEDKASYGAALRKFALLFANGVLAPERVAIHRLSVTETKRFPELSSSHYAQGMGRILPVVSAYLAKGMKLGFVREADPAVLAEQLLVSCLGYRQYRALLARANPPAPTTDDYVESALGGALLP